MRWGSHQFVVGSVEMKALLGSAFFLAVCGALADGAHHR